jgi:hypothetical protein
LLENGRQPQFFMTIKTSSNVSKMEDNLIFLETGRQPQFLENGRQPQIFEKWKTTSNFLKMEDDLKL